MVTWIMFPWYKFVIIVNTDEVSLKVSAIAMVTEVAGSALHSCRDGSYDTECGFHGNGACDTL